MRSNGQCVMCGQDKKITAHGLCTVCYHRQRRRKGTDRVKGAKAAGLVLQVDFQPMSGLFEDLKQRADAELRDVSSQVLWELSKNFERRA